MSSDNGMTFQDHITELRRRVMYSAIAVLITTVIAFIFHEQILYLLMQPAQGFTDIPSGKPIYTDLTEFLSTAMKASLLVGFFAALPFVLFQMVLFVAPGLSPSERRYLYMLIPAVIFAFILGAAFGYRILFPPAVHFLLSFGSDIATPYIRIGNYVSLMMSLLLWMGVVFETPIVLFFLSRIGIVTPRQLGRQRRYAIVVAFILGALITPTFDPINQTLVALPIIVPLRNRHLASQNRRETAQPPARQRTQLTVDTVGSSGRSPLHAHAKEPETSASGSLLLTLPVCSDGETLSGLARLHLLILDRIPLQARLLGLAELSHRLAHRLADLRQLADAEYQHQNHNNKNQFHRPNSEWHGPLSNSLQYCFSPIPSLQS